MNTHENQVMALAGICQAALCVQKLAHYGQVEETKLSMLLASILNTQPNNPEEIYQDRDNLRAGFQAIIDNLAAGGDKNVELVRYIGGMIQLERQLSKQAKHLASLGDSIQAMHRKLEHFELTDENTIIGFADIYSQLISPLGQKIQVLGKPDILKQKPIQNKIRALLLAGIRSAVLWRQLGGKRRQFFLSKGKLVNTAQQIIS